jgi:quercetin dioxygenase-like cupin family protein
VPHAGQEIEGWGGMRLRFVRTAAETDGELLEMEAFYAGGADAPPPHVHPRQTERFEVLEGSFRAVVDGVERRYETGDVFEVPAGTPHQMAAEVPSRLLWQVRPALRTAEFFEGLYGTGPDSMQGASSPAEFLRRFADEFRLAEG